VLRLAINSRISYSRLRWRDTNHFRFQGENHVWERIEVRNEEATEVPECPFNHPDQP
jgi:hypothetical protein